MRSIASECLGLLCANSGNNLTSNEVGYLIDQIVSKREPNARAGYAVALGCIHAELGGMAASYHLKNILGVLMSLSSDPHPTVHFWALQGLSNVANSAGLSFSGFVPSTLGMLAQLYVAETHNEEVDSVASSNSELEFPSSIVIARCVDSIINILGPDLQDAAKLRDLVMILTSQFAAETDFLVIIESLKCQEHISLYAPGYIDRSVHVKRLQKFIVSDSLQLRSVALDGIHNLMQRGAEQVVRSAGSTLEDQLWFSLNAAPTQETVRSIFRNWLREGALSNTAQWVQRCQRVLEMTIPRSNSKPSTAATPASALPDLQDEEVAGFAAQADVGGAEGALTASFDQELLKWQVRAFAMECLDEIFVMVASESASQQGFTALLALQAKVSDLIRIAFSASTAGVVELRLRGMRILDHILKVCGVSSVTERRADSRRCSEKLQTLTLQRHLCSNNIRHRLAQLSHQPLRETPLPNWRPKRFTSARHSSPRALSLT